MEKDQLMAIIRDVAKEDFIPIVELLLEEGITMLEVSLSNETKGLACLEAVSQHFSAKQLTIGAGTVVEKPNSKGETSRSNVYYDSRL